MMLLTYDLRQRLLANGMNAGEDHAPLVKLFNPCGAATWLLSELDPESKDTLFGLCDLGMGFPELGSVSLDELQSIKGPLGIGIERDLFFIGRYPLSVYAEAARIHGAIITDTILLDATAALLTRAKPDDRS
jgi:hypothetical protein